MNTAFKIMDDQEICKGYHILILVQILLKSHDDNLIEKKVLVHMIFKTIGDR